MPNLTDNNSLYNYSGLIFGPCTEQKQGRSRASRTAAGILTCVVTLSYVGLTRFNLWRLHVLQRGVGMNFLNEIFLIVLSMMVAWCGKWVKLGWFSEQRGRSLPLWRGWSDDCEPIVSRSCRCMVAGQAAVSRVTAITLMKIREEIGWL